MVDFDKYQEIKEGDKEKTKIAEITEGTQGELRPEGYWAAVKDQSTVEDQKKLKAIEIRCENGATMVIALPRGDQIHPKSNLSLFKRTYASFPKEGLEVTTKIDENGYRNSLEFLL